MSSFDEGRHRFFCCTFCTRKQKAQQTIKAKTNFMHSVDIWQLKIMNRKKYGIKKFLIQGFVYVGVQHRAGLVVTHPQFSSLAVGL
jgi:hypothetical protein